MKRIPFVRLSLIRSIINRAVQIDPKTFRDCLQIAVFVSVIVLIPVVGLLLSEPSVPRYENRNPTPIPNWRFSLRGMREFSTQFQSYWNDRMGFRPFLVSCQIELDRDYFKISPSPAVVIGPNKWLFLKEHLPFDAPVASRPNANAHIDYWVKIFLKRKNWLAKQNIDYIVLIGPDKHTIYPEELPRNCQFWNDDPLLDRLIVALQKNGISFCDVRPALRKAKEREQVYYSLDTHWNALGAFEASRVLLQEINKWYPEVQIPNREDFRLETSETNSFDLYRQLGRTELADEKYLKLLKLQPKAMKVKPIEVLPQENKLFFSHLQKERITPWVMNVRLPRLVFLHTSFGSPMIWMIQDQFSEVTALPSIRFPIQAIKEGNPQIVVQEMVERMLKGKLPEDEFPE